MEAMLLISTRVGMKEDVVSQIIEFPGIINAHTVFGAYDIVAIVDVQDIRGYEDVLKKKIEGIELVTALIPDMRAIHKLMEDPSIIIQR